MAKMRLAPDIINTVFSGDGGVCLAHICGAKVRPVSLVLFCWKLLCFRIICFRNRRKPHFRHERWAVKFTEICVFISLYFEERKKGGKLEVYWSFFSGPMCAIQVFFFFFFFGGGSVEALPVKFGVCLLPN